jgi:hypothetical protein
MINFKDLPNNNPNRLPEKGCYNALIKKAEMKAPKDTSKPDYLNIQLALFDDAGKSAGTIFDIISESDADLARFKLQRFIVAMNIPITGSFELKDLVKIIQNKTLRVDITKDEKEGQIPRAVVDVFSNEIYYSAQPSTTAPTSGVINAPDADDDPFLPETESTEY